MFQEAWVEWGPFFAGQTWGGLWVTAAAVAKARARGLKNQRTSLSSQRLVAERSAHQQTGLLLSEMKSERKQGDLCGLVGVGPESDFEQIGHGVGIQFFHDVGSVCFHRFDADAQVIGDLFVQPARHNSL